MNLVNNFAKLKNRINSSEGVMNSENSREKGRCNATDQWRIYVRPVTICPPPTPSLFFKSNFRTFNSLTSCDVFLCVGPKYHLAPTLFFFLKPPLERILWYNSIKTIDKLVNPDRSKMKKCVRYFLANIGGFMECDVA